MASRIAVPNIATFDTQNLPFGAVVFLQAVQDGLKTIDEQVLYRDQVRVQPVVSRIRAKSAQGQAFSVSGVALASGEDYATLVRDFETLLNSHIDLVNAFNSLVDQIRGPQ